MQDSKMPVETNYTIQNVVEETTKESTFLLPKTNSPLKDVLNVVKNVTIEPALILFTLAMSMGTIVTQSLTIRKYCLMELGNPDVVCRNLTSNPDLEEKAQALATDFLMYKTMLDTLPTVFVAGFIGSWSDKNGRKLLLIIPSIGGCLGMVLMTINAYFDGNLDVNYILIASVPFALTGNLLSMTIGAISYMADKTNEENRTVRISIIQASFLVGSPLGSAAGGILFNHFGYMVVFITSASMYLISSLYVIILIKETVHSSSSLSHCSFFEIEHIKDLIRTVCKERDHNGRRHLVLLIIAAAVSFLPILAEINVTYMYTRWKFQWSEEKYSLYTATVYMSSVFGLVVVLPILSYKFKVKDIILGIMSTMSKISNEVILTLSTQGWMLFAATPIVLFNEMNSTVTRTLLSKIASAQEQGKISAVMSAAEAAMPTIGSLMFSQMYNLTRVTFPGAIFILSACLTLIPALLFGWIYIERRNIPSQEKSLTNDKK